eukprot:Blabericola_migrator_1__1182@NODE_1300_length_4865_cov_288_526261_g384_i2_p2_GENE_NODE_1300_length_4865_cov_288_526261_g384_i2NODE_1300_length_4865_cov_288_526261_g384_i2_p2_ORF_typecomplete_len581_score65_67Mito_fiss_reg/PF05308_11/3_3e03Mito_fiss_reg/PF05308_11/9_2_NODE_1300_length_4865_cov_288_526261_g384_i229264668
MRQQIDDEDCIARRACGDVDLANQSTSTELPLLPCEALLFERPGIKLPEGGWRFDKRDMDQSPCDTSTVAGTPASSARLSSYLERHEMSCALPFDPISTIYHVPPVIYGHPPYAIIPTYPLLQCWGQPGYGAMYGPLLLPQNFQPQEATSDGPPAKAPPPPPPPKRKVRFHSEAPRRSSLAASKILNISLESAASKAPRESQAAVPELKAAPDLKNVNDKELTEWCLPRLRALQRLIIHQPRCRANYMKLGIPGFLFDSSERVISHWGEWRLAVMSRKILRSERQDIADLHIRQDLGPLYGFMHFVGELARLIWSMWQNDTLTYDKRDRILSFATTYPVDLLKCPGTHDIFEAVTKGQKRSPNWEQLVSLLQSGECNPVTVQVAIRKQGAGTHTCNLLNLLLWGAEMYQCCTGPTKKVLPDKPPRFTDDRISGPSGNEPKPLLVLLKLRLSVFEGCRKPLSSLLWLRTLVSLRTFEKLSDMEYYLIDVAIVFCITPNNTEATSAHGHWFHRLNFTEVSQRHPEWKALPNLPMGTIMSQQASPEFVRGCSRLADLVQTKAPLLWQVFPKLVNLAGILYYTQ